MKYYKTTPDVWPPLAAAVDAQPTFKKDWIDSGACEHILPQTLETRWDGNVHVSIPEWMTSTRPDLVAPFLAQMTEESEEDYLLYMGPEPEPDPDLDPDGPPPMEVR